MEGRNKGNETYPGRIFTARATIAAVLFGGSIGLGDGAAANAETHLATSDRGFETVLLDTGPETTQLIDKLQALLSARLSSFARNTEAESAPNIDYSFMLQLDKYLNDYAGLKGKSRTRPLEIEAIGDALVRAATSKSDPIISRYLLREFHTRTSQVIDATSGMTELLVTEDARLKLSPDKKSKIRGF